ncbi:hypothetical protein HD806DRAFT_535111 [Xylariaceae sp. AK1471]|nr:hypothetical protein HD806DRAFT_535111 [Xylariaceae sp. AK1471]
MAGSSTPVYNGEHPVKIPHNFSNPTDAGSLAQQRLQSYMATRDGGGDPVTALALRGGTTESSISERRAEVIQNLRDNVVKYQNGKGSGA